MPEENATWDTASVVDAPPPAVDPPAPDAPTPVETAAPPAEPATLEKPDAAPLEAEPTAARESASEPVIPEPAKDEPKDEYVAEADDPAELAALTTPAAKRWAKRQFKDAEPIRKFQSFDQPISEFVDELNQRSPSRHKEMVDDIATAYPDYISKKLFGVTFEEAKTRLQANDQPSTATEEMPGELPATNAEARLAQEKQQLQSQFDALKQEFDALKGEVTNEKQSGRQKEIVSKQTELYNNVWSVVDEGTRNLGLEPQPNDPPKLASLKKAAARLLSRSHIEEAFDASEDNRKLVQHVYEATTRGEFQNAFREEDNLKVRARAAFESVKSSPEVQAIISEIENLANQSKATTRGADPIPPAPGSTLGVTIKPPTTWDEAERPSAAA